MTVTTKASNTDASCCHLHLMVTSLNHSLFHIVIIHIWPTILNSGLTYIVYVVVLLIFLWFPVKSTIKYHCYVVKLWSIILSLYLTVVITIWCTIYTWTNRWSVVSYILRGLQRSSKPGRTLDSLQDSTSGQSDAVKVCLCVCVTMWWAQDRDRRVFKHLPFLRNMNKNH